jgi:putative tricarboxylic transport membrane protein
MMGLRNQKDLLAGGIFAAIGLTFFLAARALPFGSTGRMGPGYFPLVLSLLLVASGVLVFLRGLIVRGDAPGPLAIRGLLCVVAGAVVFAILVRPAGFAPALAGSMLVTSLAHPGTRFAPTLILVPAVVAASCMIFIVGLGLPWPVLGPWLSGP